MATKKNIVVGAAYIFVGPSGRASAPNAASGEKYVTTMTGTAAGKGVTLGWRDVGYTQDGLEISNDPSWTDVEVDQLLDAAKIFQDGMSVSLSTSFAEATLENLVVAWGQSADTLTSTASDKTWRINGGSLGAAPLERGLIAVGNGTELDNSNNYRERTYHAYRVLSVESSSHTLNRAEATVIPVTFRALPDDTAEYGVVRERNL